MKNNNKNRTFENCEKIGFKLKEVVVENKVLMENVRAN